MEIRSLVTKKLHNNKDRKSASVWKVDILTIYPDMFPGILEKSLSGRALSDGYWSINATDIRQFALDKHRSVDSQPYGGGPGMIMRADVLARAIDSVHSDSDTRPLVYMTPRGQKLTQKRAHNLANGDGITIICGRFEGIDERIISSRNIEEISIGDYILSGGEPAAQVLLDACVRLLPNVVGKVESLKEESFENDLLEYPHFTKPRNFEGKEVPEVLLSGNHEHIKYWRNQQAENITRERRTDLWERKILTDRCD